MAIRFVDVDPKDREPKPSAAEAGRSASKTRAAKPDAAASSVPPAEEPAAPVPAVDEARSGPKTRARRKAETADGADAGSGTGAGTPPDAAAVQDGLLPGLQVHAKPTPKPRGRKKAFG